MLQHRIAEGAGKCFVGERHFVAHALQNEIVGIGAIRFLERIPPGVETDIELVVKGHLREMAVATA